MRRNKRKTTRVCALCDTVIYDTHVVCKNHYDFYIKHKEETWMIELIDAQRKQFEIDNQENYILSGVELPQKRYYRRLSADDLQQVNFYRSKGLGAKNIGKILAVNWFAIEKYLRKTEQK